ncbi:FAD-dependent monooxygenase [uncultured Algimonas sp.]|uniref:FAD-dependent monooxygenase n=1 Tax=uncultured Algimonas sp. TaxID=1547920 RepID=UPI00260DAF24|nr:FAD-dependent monooxygenase [uncultured Algimonas sp.]
MKILIAGGGIGGLTAALSLVEHGYTVRVVERAPEIGEVGAGIQLSPNAMQVMKALRLDPALTVRGVEPEAIELRMGVSGLRLIRTELGEAARQRWGAPYLHIHRADLIETLQSALDERAPGSIQLGASVESYQCDESGIRARLQDGSEIAGDVLIGADGIHSAIRAQMIGPDAPVFTGNVAWRTVVPVSRLGSNAPDRVACAWMGRGRHAVTYLLKGGTHANFVGVVEQRTWTEESWSQTGDRKSALADFEGWHPRITQLIEQSDALFRWALFDRPPLPRWTDGRVALLGDAAHPMLPFIAQGAAMAIEDGWTLARCLTEGRDQGDAVAVALQRYQNRRLARATAMQSRSRVNAGLFHRRNTLSQLATYAPIWTVGRVRPETALRRFDPIYGHDVTA